MNWISNVVGRVRSHAVFAGLSSAEDDILTSRFHSLWLAYESSSPPEKDSLLRELQRSFLRAYKPASSLEPIPNLNRFATIVSHEYFTKITEWLSKDEEFSSIFLLLHLPMPSSNIHETLQSLLVLSWNSPCLEIMTKSKVFSVTFQLLHQMAEYAEMPEIQNDIATKQEVVSTIFHLMKMASYQPEPVADMISSGVFENMMSLCLRTNPSVFMNRIQDSSASPTSTSRPGIHLFSFIQEKMVDLLSSCLSHGVPDSVLQLVVKTNSIEQWIAILRNHETTHTRIISLSEAFLSLLKKSTEHSFCLVDLFRISDGVRALEEAVLSIHQATELPKSFPHFLDSFAELVYIGQQDISHLAISASAQPHQQAKLRELLSNREASEETRIRWTDPFFCLQRIFLETKHPSIRQKVLDCVMSIYAANPLNYFILETIRANTLPLFVQEIDLLTDTLKTQVLDLLVFIITNVGALPYKELFTICSVLHKTVSTRTLTLALERFEKIVQQDSTYNRIFREVGLLDLVIKELENLSLQIKHSSAIQGNLVGNVLCFNIHERQIQLSQNVQAPSKPSRHRRNYLSDTITMYNLTLATFKDGTEFDVTRLSALLVSVRKLICDDAGNMNLAWTLNLYSILHQLTPFGFCRKSIVSIMMDILELDNLHCASNLSSFFANDLKINYINFEARADLLQGMSSFLSKSKDFQNCFATSNGLQYLLNLLCEFSSGHHQRHDFMSECVSMFHKIGSTCVHVIKGNPKSRRIFSDYSRLFADHIRSTGLLSSPFAAVVLDVLFDIAMEWESENDRWRSMYLKNPRVICACLILIKGLDTPLQIETCENIHRILVESCENIDQMKGLAVSTIFSEYYDALINREHDLHGNLIKIMTPFLSYWLSVDETRRLLDLLLLENADSMLAVEVERLFSKNEGQISFFELNYSSPCGILLSQTAADETNWPLPTGFSMSFWIWIPDAPASQTDLPAFICRLTRHTQETVIAVGLSNSNLCYSVGERNTHIFDRKLPASKWTHITLTHIKGRIQSSIANMYVDGVLAECAKVSFPSTHTSKLTLHLGVWMLEHTSTMYLASSICRLGDIYLFDDLLSPQMILRMYLLGPAYTGEFNGDLSVFSSHKRIGPQLETIRSLSVSSRIENLRIRMHLSASNFLQATINGPYEQQDKISYISSFRSHDFVDSLRSVGGVSMVLYKLHLSKDFSTFDFMLKLLCLSIRNNPKNAREMQLIKGYEILAHLLRQSSENLSLFTLDAVLNLVGFHHDDGHLASNTQALRNLLTDHGIWSLSPTTVQLARMESIAAFLVDQKYSAHNISKLRRAYVLWDHLAILQSDLLSESLVPKVTDNLSILFAHGLAREEVQVIVDILMSTLPTPTEATMAVGDGASFLPARLRSFSTHNVQESRSRATSNVRFSFRRQKINPRMIGTRNLILQLIWSHLKSEYGSRDIRIFGKELTHIHLLAIIGSPVSSGSQTSLLETDLDQSSETSAVLSLKILAHFLSHNMSFSSKFRASDSFSILEQGLLPYASNSSIFTILACIAFQKSAPISATAVSNYGSIFHAVFPTSTPKPSLVTSVPEIYSPDALSIALRLLKKRTYTPRKSVRRSSIAGSPSQRLVTQRRISVGEWEVLSTSSSNASAFGTTTNVGESNEEGDVAVAFVQFLTDLLQLSPSYVELARNPDHLSLILEVLFFHISNSNDPSPRSSVSQEHLRNRSRTRELAVATAELASELSSEVFRFMCTLFSAFMTSSQKAFSLLQSVVEAAPSTVTRRQNQIYQSRIIGDLMAFLEQSYLMQKRKDIASNQNLGYNAAKLSDYAVEKFLRGKVIMDDTVLLRFCIDVRQALLRDQQSNETYLARGVVASNVFPEGVSAISAKALNRVVLFCLEQSAQKSDASESDIWLQILFDEKAYSSASDQSESDYLFTIMSLLIRIWGNHSEAQRNFICMMLRELLRSKRSQMNSIFGQISGFTEIQSLIGNLHHDSQAADFLQFFESCNSVSKSKELQMENFHHMALQRYKSYCGLEDDTSELQEKIGVFEVKELDPQVEDKHGGKWKSDFAQLIQRAQENNSTFWKKRKMEQTDQYAHALSSWKKIQFSLGAVFENSNIGPSDVSWKWSLDAAEGPSRIRIKLVPQDLREQSLCNVSSFDVEITRLKAGQPSGLDVSSEHDTSQSSEDTSGSIKASQTDHGNLRNSIGESESFSSSNDDDRSTYDETHSSISTSDQYTEQEKEDDTCFYGFLHAMDADEVIEFQANCQRVALMDTCRGIFVLGNKSAYFIENYEFAANGDLAEVTEETPEFEWARDGSQPEAKPKALRHDFIKWSYESLRDIQKRRYLLRQVALELFGQDGCSHMLVFNANERDDVYSRITSHLPQSTADMLFTPIFGTNDEFEDAPRLIGWKKSLTTKWQQGQLSNFQYLMHLNTMAGRTYNDLTQYPVFPWVIADYTSETLDLGDEKIYRDLTKPMGAITDRREEIARERFELWDDPNVPKFHYGSHYSSSGIVLYFLIRMEPFTQHHRDLQGGRFDHPDRLFHALQDAWRTSTENSLSDVKELIPEFYSSFEYLLNRASHEFGTKQTGQRIDQVVLPPWAKGDPRLFMRLMLQALESDYVSNNLHNWIDLIFGYKQSGKAAEDAVNLFYYLTYEGSVDIDSIQDPQQRKAIIAQINNFGQTPKQIFRRAHPKRLVMPSTLQFFPALNLLVPTVLKSLDSAVSNIALAGDKPIPLTNRKIGMPPSFSKCLAWGFTDFSVRILNIGDEKILSVAESFHDDQVSCLAMTDDGNTIVSGGYDSIVNVWRFKKRGLRPYDITLAQSLIGHSKPITCVAVSRTFSIIASGAEDGLCVVWCLNRLSYIRQIFVKSPVVSITINETNGDIVTCTASEIFSWSINGDLHGQGTIKNAPDDSFTSLAVTKDPEWTTNYYITGHRSGAIRFWNTFPMAVHENPVCASLITVRQLVCEETVLKAHDTPITALSATSEQRKFFSGDESGKVVCWSLPIDESQIIRF
eukprot:TRINITY_DN1221_c0_g2_i5.p1 TRINITY_DN1221_c0_g2~~TRINITY_DN1221_c0_g2_i5.p1  ORF type:complete len:3003 (-),score=493.93 TRINITY_DN1221_c0_g2_i5:105-9113(-)